MSNKIKDAFEQVHAEDSLKASTQEYLQRRLYRRTSRPSRQLRYFIPAAACFLFLLLGFGGYHVYFTPVSVISIDINPSVEWSVNRFDRIISVDSYNEDGQELSNALDVTYKKYPEAIDMLVSSPIVTDCLSRDEYLSITVVGDNDTQNSEMLETVRSCTAGIQNTHCDSAGYDELNEAHETGLSCGKYKAYCTLKSLDPDITPEEVQTMTMREIRDLIQQLAEENSVEIDSSQFTGNGTHNQGHDSDQGTGNAGSGNSEHGNSEHGNSEHGEYKHRQ